MITSRLGDTKRKKCDECKEPIHRKGVYYPNLCITCEDNYGEKV